MTDIIITPESNPDLWAILNVQYLGDGLPRNVTNGTEIYEVYITTASVVNFKLINNMNYIDSRSNRNGRSASYKGLNS